MEIKNKILKILESSPEGEIASTSINDFFNSGDYCLYLPTTDNVVIIDNIEEDVYISLYELLRARKIKLIPCDGIEFMWHGAPIYNLPLYKKKHLKNKKICWMPTLLKLNK